MQAVGYSRPPNTISMKALAIYLGQLIFSLMLLSPLAHAGNITIDDATLVDKNGSYVVDSNMDFLFSDSAIEALESGVGLHIEFNLNINRARRYIWDKRIFRLSKRIKIERHALTERYIVTDQLDQQRRLYESIDSAVAGLNDMSDIPIASISELREGDYTMSLRARLDIEALPAPLRPIAYISPAWRMSSGWFEWNSTQ
jgi:hypothetical protein